MADAYQLETSTDRYLLEDGSGVWLLEPVAADVFVESLHSIMRGIGPLTTVSIGGLLTE